MFFPTVLWDDGLSHKVFVEPQVLALQDQIFDKDKTIKELQKQKEFNSFVAGCAKFKNGNIAFARDGSFQATIWPAGTKIKGKWRVATQ